MESEMKALRKNVWLKCKQGFVDFHTWYDNLSSFYIKRIVVEYSWYYTYSDPWYFILKHTLLHDFKFIILVKNV